MSARPRGTPYSPRVRSEEGEARVSVSQIGTLLFHPRARAKSGAQPLKTVRVYIVPFRSALVGVCYVYYCLFSE